VASVVRPLSRDDDLSSFRCGDKDLDRWLRAHAIPNHFELKLARAYVAQVDGAGPIVGYVALTGGAFKAVELPGTELPGDEGRRLPGYPLPVLVLGRLATDRQVQGQGIGKALMKFTFQMAVTLSEQIGCIGVALDSKPTARSYYDQFGFKVIENLDAPRRSPLTPMFLSLRKILLAMQNT
jgi:predicted N-acetyltransferase YhbS